MIGEELSPADWGGRMDCCNGILAAVPPTGILWSSDEAHVHLSGTVNKQNFRYWAAENPPNHRLVYSVVYRRHWALRF
jgi:hypothetical protein